MDDARIAVVSDIHSNLEALESVLADAGTVSILCLGDVVGYGASPNEVVGLLADRRAVAVLGNHDYAALTGDTAMFNTRAAISARWTSKALSDRSTKYLISLPRTYRRSLGEVKGFFVHGSPDDPLWEYVHPSTHSQLLGHYLEKLSVGIVGLGHTHIPFVSKEEGGVVFNPGSVGQPRDGDRRASYATVRSSEGSVHIEVKRVEYDYEKSASKIRGAGLPESNASRLYTGA